MTTQILPNGTKVRFFSPQEIDEYKLRPETERQVENNRPSRGFNILAFAKSVPSVGHKKLGQARISI